MYYSVEELDSAVSKTIKEVQRRTLETKEFIRGYNDCAALLAIYDRNLRGKKSRAFDVISLFEWNSVKEFIQKLYLRGYTVKEYMQYCNYEIVKDKKPNLGDVAFDNGAMLCDGEFWVSVNEDNTGVYFPKQKMFLERKLSVIARPLRS
jgi:hypothetical protein